MPDRIRPVTYSDKICFKCLNESDNINTYNLDNRGYGSIFDSFKSTLQLCDECNCENLAVWFNEEPLLDEDYFITYMHEDKICDFVESLPIQGKELFNNRCASELGVLTIDSQDWIDIELEIAPDSVYRKYGMYSPSEIRAYRDRFPSCKHVYLKTYNDGSKCCVCKYGAYGNKDGSCGVNTSSKCYKCTNYIQKGFDDFDREAISSYEYVYCTECVHFKLKDGSCPYCKYEDICNINNCEDSMSFEDRPYYKKFK